MARVTGFTAERAQQIEDSVIVSGSIVNGILILVRHDGTQVPTGSVIGPQGIQGIPGATNVMIVTSTTRPTGADLILGLIIYETDTETTHVWDGVKWVRQTASIETNPAHIGVETFGAVASVGSTGKTADAGHVHPMPSVAVLPGEMRLWAANTPPAGWHFCDGSAISRIDNPNLFAAIGTIWGAGNGTTTFNVPDLRGRTPIGAGAGQSLTPRSLATVGGEEAHVLSVAELALHNHLDAGHTHETGAHGHTDSGHTHTATQPGHSHRSSNASPSGIVVTGAGGFVYQTGAGGLTMTSVANNTSNDSAGPITIASASAVIQSGTGSSGPSNAANAAAGSGNAHNNMQPYAVVNYIIALG